MAVTHSFAPSASASTQNIWTVTGADTFTFADMVTYDEANALTLLAATACTTSMTLTYAIRPAAQRALQISFVLSGTSAGAGDTLDITGTDAWGNAQLEMIDVSGGDGTYNGSCRWATITNIDCTGWADGTLAVSQPIKGFIWKNSDQYTIMNYARIYLGNSSNATILSDSKCSIYCQEPYNANAQSFIYLSAYSSLILDTVTIHINNTYTGGSLWLIQSHNIASTTATCSLTGVALMNSGTSRVNAVMNPGIHASSQLSNILCLGGAELNGINCPLTNFLSHNAISYSMLNSSGTITNFFITDPGLYYYYMSGTYVNTPRGMYATASATTNSFLVASITVDKYMIDFNIPSWGITWTGTTANTASMYRQYSVNLRILDRNNNAISGATVRMLDKDGTQQFSVTTDANGDIAEQIVNYIRYYYDAGEASETFSPHTLEISAAGYKTWKSIITLDKKIDAKIRLYKSVYPVDIYD